MLAGKRGKRGKRGSRTGEVQTCLVISRDAGAPSETIAQHVLELKPDDIPEAAIYLAHMSPGAHRVRIPTFVALPCHVCNINEALMYLHA
jgi:hypothetical protein